jgi:hypothetical protein
MDTNQEKERKLIRCVKCGNPIATVNGSEITLIKNNKGKPMRIKVAVQHDAGGRFDISCECGGGFSFSTVRKTLPMAYHVIPKSNDDNAVDKPSVDASH